MPTCLHLLISTVHMMLMEMSFVTVKFWKNGNSDVMVVRDEKSKDIRIHPLGA